MDLTLLNVEQLVHKNHHVLPMLYQHHNIAIQIYVMFMEIFRRQQTFLDGISISNSILYQQDQVVEVALVVGGENVEKFINIVSNN